ncbi:MAG: septum formation protein Maf [Treponema sp.]|nr:septum formation protein Maf [Treponema sp.]
MEALILASSSPRRQEILKMLGIPFVVNPADIVEKIPQDVDPKDAPEYLACKKVEAVAQRISSVQEDTGWILGADTAIFFEDRLYGKPSNKEEAVEMIRLLQGHEHEVITGVALYNDNLHDITTRRSVNRISFAPMTETEIEWYVNTGEWHGAAGGYRIQGLASCFIKKIEGTVSSIMGLPIFELYDMLREQGYSFITKA